MWEIVKLMLPIIMQMLPQLFNKPKAKLAEWFADGAKAAIADKKPWSAFWMSSAKCMTDGMTEDQYTDVQLAVENASLAARAATRQTAARLAAEGGGQ